MRQERHEHEIGGAPGRPEAAQDQRESLVLSEAEVPLIEDLRKRFRESWEENRREGDPDVEFTFDLRPHARAADAEGLEELFSDADIVLLEGPGWRKEDLQYLRRIARGEGPRPVRDIRIKPHQTSPKEYMSEKENALYGSGAYVAYVDTSADDPSLDKFYDAQLAFYRGSDPPRTYDGMTARRRKYLDAVAEELRVREQHFAERIPEEIRNALNEREDLAAKENVRVLLQMGSAHTPTSIAMKHEGQDVRRDFGDTPMFSAGLEYIRARAFGTAASRSEGEMNALAARTALEDVLSRILEDPLDNLKAKSWERDALLSRLSCRFTSEEIRTLWQGAEGFSDAALRKALTEKGIRIPKTREELEQFM